MDKQFFATACASGAYVAREYMKDDTNIELTWCFNSFYAKSSSRLLNAQEEECEVEEEEPEDNERESEGVSLSIDIYEVQFLWALGFFWIGSPTSWHQSINSLQKSLIV